jgi:hypothetical protein
MILRVLCCMVDSEHLHVIYAEVFFLTLSFILSFCTYCYEIMNKHMLESLSFAYVCNIGRLFVSHVHPSISTLQCCTFVLFHIVTYYTSSQLSAIYVSNTHHFKIMCTLVSTSMILGRLGSAFLFAPTSHRM